MTEALNFFKCGSWGAYGRRTNDAIELAVVPYCGSCRLLSSWLSILESRLHQHSVFRRVDALGRDRAFWPTRLCDPLTRELRYQFPLTKSSISSWCTREKPIPRDCNGIKLRTPGWPCIHPIYECLGVELWPCGTVVFKPLEPPHPVLPKNCVFDSYTTKGGGGHVALQGAKVALEMVDFFAFSFVFEWNEIHNVIFFCDRRFHRSTRPKIVHKKTAKYGMPFSNNLQWMRGGFVFTWEAGGYRYSKPFHEIIVDR